MRCFNTQPFLMCTCSQRPWSQGRCQYSRKMSTKRRAESHSRASNRPRIMKSGNSRADSERDSGFSGSSLLLPQFYALEIIGYHLIEPSKLLFLVCSVDASSEHMSTMDSEDSPRPAVRQGPQTSGSASQLAVVGGSYSNLSPMIIMNNVLLKQVRHCYTAKLICVDELVLCFRSCSALTLFRQ